ncbi:YegS/Rv2252/BmrU family lipid kinase [Streptomyces griseoviridis]
MRQFTAVVNPTAGRAAGAAALLAVARLLREAGAELETAYSRSLPHAQELARAAGDRGRVVLAVGGDGMAGSIGGALSGTGTVLGLVPAGRGNDFARALRLPTAPGELADLLLHGTPRPVDTVEVSSAVHDRTVVLGSVYAGVDALANLYANRAGLLRGAASYYAGGLRAVTTWRAAHYRVTVDGTEHRHTGYTVVAANSGYYGSGRAIAPDARVDDGLLDIVLIRDAPRRLFFTLMNELTTGAHVHRPEVRILRGREIHIAADREIPYGADGEVDAALPVTARILPGALRVLYADPHADFPGQRPAPDPR